MPVIDFILSNDNMLQTKHYCLNINPHLVHVYFGFNNKSKRPIGKSTTTKNHIMNPRLPLAKLSHFGQDNTDIYNPLKIATAAY
ncbi:hypothetical protein CXF95_14485 [Paraglaciecola sp. MB-3u-78]|nr:hypothetical protein CXF95_14485 [Paraglaciecola sp. MB-3u-78]